MKKKKDIQSNLSTFRMVNPQTQLVEDETISQEAVVENQSMPEDAKQNQLANYLIAKKDFKEYEEMYKVVDFLNKNLKSEGIIFGLTKSNGDNTISVYNIGKV